MLEFKGDEITPESMLEAAIEAGANECDSLPDGLHQVSCDSDKLHEVQAFLSDKFGDPKVAKLIWKPKSIIEVSSEEQAEKLFNVVEALEESDDVRQHITNFLKKHMEGIFIKEGYVVPDSLKVIDYSAGTVISESLSGDLHYNVLVEADVYRPGPGDVLKGKIDDKNKFGIHILIEPLDIILGYVHHAN